MLLQYWAPTTTKHYLMDARTFMRHVEVTFAGKSRLTRKQFLQIQYELSALLKRVTRRVNVHRQGVMRKKSSECLSTPYCHREYSVQFNINNVLM